MSALPDAVTCPVPTNPTAPSAWAVLHQTCMVMLVKVFLLFRPAAASQIQQNRYTQLGPHEGDSQSGLHHDCQATG